MADAAQRAARIQAGGAVRAARMSAVAALLASCLGGMCGVTGVLVGIHAERGSGKAERQDDLEERAQRLLQKRVEEKGEMAVLLSSLQSLRHQTEVSSINEVR